METEGREAEPRWEIPEARYRSELKTAWLQGWQAAVNGVIAGENLDEAADYAERVVGGLTEPEVE